MMSLVDLNIWCYTILWLLPLHAVASSFSLGGLLWPCCDPFTPQEESCSVWLNYVSSSLTLSRVPSFLPIPSITCFWSWEKWKNSTKARRKGLKSMLLETRKGKWNEKRQRDEKRSLEISHSRNEEREKQDKYETYNWQAFVSHSRNEEREKTRKIWNIKPSIHH